MICMSLQVCVLLQQYPCLLMRSPHCHPAENINIIYRIFKQRKFPAKFDGKKKNKRKKKGKEKKEKNTMLKLKAKWPTVTKFELNSPPTLQLQPNS